MKPLGCSKLVIIWECMNYEGSSTLFIYLFNFYLSTKNHGKIVKDCTTIFQPISVMSKEAQWEITCWMN